jgi:uncharacterized membrane protein YozB (DUF420 family)
MVATGADRFAPQDARDRYALPAFVALVWVGILMGFAPEIAGQIRDSRFTYPVAVHIHAAVFVGWLALLTSQVALVRTGRVARHRRLGAVGPWLAGAVVLMGLVVSYVVDRMEHGTPKGDTPFLSIQLIDMVNFGSLAAAALLLRRDAAAHKRLILLATFSLVDAGFSRWWGKGLEAALGKGFLGEWMAVFLGNILLIVGLGLYDLATRRRLHPAYVVGAAWALSWQALAIYLYVAPWWPAVAARLIGR